ncbi:hypothetical protein PGTUg99_017210 [Puccinia graminis f. sp. tritici]|uniref:non-specific serine/threonine protein kinase n=1 Tax=Puccinia graminis f. sp. tritici TaxID=56615 RepID=A0A5B0LKB4_PUCGR|nr:hypothetical protein PGTUg99_017210 [Puccinia graminis f. sp. tritici]
MSAATITQIFQPASPAPSSPSAASNPSNPKSKVLALRSLQPSPTPSSVPSPKMSQPSSAHVTFPLSPTLLPPPYSHLPIQHQQHQQQQQQQHQQQQQQQQHNSSIQRPQLARPNSLLSPRPSSPPSPLVLSPLNTTLLPAHAPLSPRPSHPLASPGACPPYLYELAQADRRAGSGFISREPSLPSIMSMPRTRPASPDPIHSRKTSFAARRANLATGVPGSSSSPTSPQVSRRFFTPTSARGLSNLCMFEDGLQHYERVRSPSLRGHSRRGSLIHSVPDKSKDELANEMFELDLSEDFAEETFRQPRWSDDEDDADSERDHEATGARKLFKVGDRVGVGTLHQGYRVRDLFDTSSRSGCRLSKASTESSGESGILEVVRQIGVGSYAVVYLVREVLYDPALEPEPTALDSTLSQTPKASDGFASLSKLDPLASSRTKGSSEGVVYGRDFALKCLCKRNLSDELLVLQRGEAELHRSLPLHNNIVALHRALETPNWLFLVIEYCPGQDLFYWLEQARDSQDLESLSSRTNSCAPHLPSSIQPHLHSTEDKSREVGSAQVTAPPLNTPPSPSLLASTADDEMLSRRRLRLISKMFVQMCEAVEACHQAGVCHRDIKPENFIVVDDRKGTLGDNWKAQSTEHQIGVRSSVTVKITDWGLGTSSKACEDFDCGSKPYMAYECRNNLNPTYEPIQADVWSLGIVLLNLLYHRCPWADPSCSDPDFREFRHDPVSFLQGRFDGMTQSVATFLAENVFVEVGAGRSQRRISAGKFGEWAQNLLHHMGGGQSHASVSDATIAMSPSYTRGVIDQRRSLRGSSLGGLSKRSSQLFHPINLPPAVPEVLSPPELSPTELPVVIEKEVCQIEKQPLNPWPEKSSDLKDFADEPTEILTDMVLNPGAVKESADVIGEDSESCTSASKVGSDNPKRRKRGARKGRKPEGRRNGSEAGYLSSTNEQEGEVDMLDGLAEASQSLAREISQATKTMKPSDEGATSLTTTKRKLNIAERMMEKFRDGSNPDLQAFVARARAREAAYMGKATSNTASAPAQLQDVNRHGQRNVFSRAAMSTTSSSGIATTMSTSSTTSWGGGSDCSSFSKPPTHWTSASHRRERIQKTTPSANVTAPIPSTPLLPTAPISRKKAPVNHPSGQTETTTTITSNPPVNNKKEESKNKLAQLLTTFKRFNSTVGNHHSSSSSSAAVPAAATTTTSTTRHPSSTSNFITDSH